MLEYTEKNIARWMSNATMRDAQRSELQGRL